MAAKSKDVLYTDLQRYVKNKDTSVQHYVAGYLNKLQAMFVWTGVPDTIDVRTLEYWLMTKGHVLMAKHEGDLYAFSGTPTGDLDAYYQPKQYLVTNPWLNLNETYDIGKDGVLVRNDYLMEGVLPTLGRYAVTLTDSEISLNTAAVLSRITMLISASDDRTKQSADLFLQKILAGDISVIGESAFMEGVKLQTLPTTNSAYINQLIELTQYYKASLYNELGLNANYNMKRERLTTGELQVNVDALLPLADNMLAERKRAVQQVNDLFGTDIDVDFGSAWKTIHEEEEQNETNAETDSRLHEVVSGTDWQRDFDDSNDTETETRTDTETSEVTTEDEPTSTEQADEQDDTEDNTKADGNI